MTRHPSTLPTRPLRRRRPGALITLLVRKGAWRAATRDQRRWACAEIGALLRDLSAGYHPRQAIARARRRAC